MTAVRVVWKSDGEVLKDQTVPCEHSRVENVGDSVRISGLGVDVKLEVEFSFDPPMRFPEAPA